MMNTPCSRSAYADVIVVGRVPALAVTTARDVYAASDTFAAVRDIVGGGPTIRAAVRLASPSLSASLDVWLAGGVLKNKRTPLSVLSYVLRMATRCTPFGLFASVGSVTAAQRTTLGVTSIDEQRFVTRPDAQWLDGVLTDYQQDEHHAWRAPVVSNDLVIERGDALYVMDDRHATRVDSEARTPVWRYDPIHVQINDAARWLRRAAAQPVPLAELVGRTAGRFGASPEIALRLIRKLIDARVLTFARPSLLATPLPALIAHVAGDSQAAALGDLAAAVAAFEGVDAAQVTAERIAMLDTAFQRVHRIEGSSFGIDTVHDFTGCLGADVLGDAALLAATMLADGAAIELDAHLRAFITRYESLDRLVPLLELVHDDFVLTAEGVRSAIRTQRETLLVGLAAAALRDGTREISLDDDSFDIIFPAVRDAGLRQSCEAGFVVAARSRVAVEGGDYRIVPTAGANSDGIAKSASRFTPLLGPAFVERVTRGHAAAESDAEIIADLDFRPIETRSGNLIMRPPRHAYAVADATTLVPAGVQRISPADLFIGVEDGLFVVYSRSLERRVRIDETYLLETGYFAPPHMRFLAQIARQGRRAPRPFDWGPTPRALPFLPRLRYGRIVLAVARWIVPRSELAGDPAHVTATIQRWRTAWGLPRWVNLTERDVKLLLDLDSPAARDLLRDGLPKYRGDDILLEEMLPDFDEMWLERDGAPVAHEFVASFVAGKGVTATVAADEPAATRDVRPPPCPLGPASPWVYVKVYANANELHALVRDIVPRIVEGAADLIDRWFFLRYRDPDHHVRLRLHATDGRGECVVTRVLQILEPLLAAGRLTRYTFDTYRQEPERFGGHAALEPVEHLFHADSARVVRALAKPIAGETPSERALRTLVPMLRAWFSTFELAPWLAVTAAQSRQAGPIDYALVRRINGWLAAGADAADCAESAAIATIATLEKQAQLDRPSGYLFGALAHVHFNRAGIDFADERRLEAHLWRALRAYAAGRPSHQTPAPLALAMR